MATTVEELRAQVAAVEGELQVAERKAVAAPAAELGGIGSLIAGLRVKLAGLRDALAAAMTTQERKAAAEAAKAAAEARETAIGAVKAKQADLETRTAAGRCTSGGNRRRSTGFGRSSPLAWPAWGTHTRKGIEMARQYDEVLQAMSRNRAALAERVAEIRADQRYTAEGKRELITQAYTEAMRQHNGLKAELAAAREAALVTARGRAFASHDVSPAGENNYRAAIAQAREASRDGRQMQSLVDQAVATRDSTLLRALAFIGHETANGGLLRVVAQHEGTVADLLDVEARLGNAQSPDMRLANSMAATAPSRPAEVNQMAANAAMQ